jgi:hypothetical protein
MKPSKKILALDLGKRNAIACGYASVGGEYRYQSVQATPLALQDLMMDIEANRVVLEIGTSAG